MTLGEKQRLFATLVPRLIDKAHALGFLVTLGDAYRDPRVFGTVGADGPVVDGKRVAYGHIKSAHKLRLAIDLNLFSDGVFVATTEGHQPLGEWWEQQHELCRWGGRFQDGNHYSLEHDGVK